MGERVSVCHTARTMKGVQQDVCIFDEDERRPFEVGVQARASNRPELRKNNGVRGKNNRVRFI